MLMKNTVFFQKKACPIAVRCLTSILYFFLFSLSSLAACVDKEPVDEEDAVHIWRRKKVVVIQVLVQHFLS